MHLTHITSNQITIGGVTFVNVPIILRVDGDPIIEMVKDVKLGYTTQIRIYDETGKYLSKITGTRAYPATDDKSVVIEKKYRQWDCLHKGNKIFTIDHTDPDRFRFEGKLYTKSGIFLKISNEDAVKAYFPSGDEIKLEGVVMRHVTLSNCQVGFDVNTSTNILGVCAPK